jgi:2'-5' RNA ligase
VKNVRTFIAIELEEEVKDHLAEAQAETTEQEES